MSTAQDNELGGRGYALVVFATAALLIGLAALTGSIGYVISVSR